MKCRISVAIALMTLAVASVSCGDDDGRATRTVEAGPTTSAPTTAAPTITVAKAVVPPTTASPALSSYRLRIDGIGPIAVGMSVAQARSAAGTDLTLKKEPYCDVLTAPRGPDGVALIVTSPPTGRIELIVVNDPTVATLSGIRVGSTEVEVKAAYPGRLRSVNPSLPVHRLVYEAMDPALADRVLVFVIDDARVATMYAGVRNQVEADEICG